MLLALAAAESPSRYKLMSSPASASGDPFALLGLPRRFRLRREEIESAHLQASLVWHPDRFALRPNQERISAEDKMATINAAYAILKDPLERALALLASEGFSMTEGTDTSSSPEFLMAMMELKEEAANAIAADDPQQIKDISTKLSTLEQQEVTEAETNFDTIAQEPQRRAELLEAARSHLQRAAYYRKTRQDLDRPKTR